MAEFPGFTIWTDAYLADTSHLTTIEHGAYFLLLMAMWRAGGYLPNDDVKLARFCRASPGEWKKMRAHLFEFFTEDGDKITQGRLLDELEKARDRSRKASNNARSKYRKTKEVPPADAKRKASGSTARDHAEPLQNASETDASISISISTDKKDPPSGDPKKTPRDELLAVLDAERAEAVIAHRQRIKKPLTAYAAKLLAGKLAKWHAPNEAADVMIANGWQGFEAEWMQRQQPRGSPQAPVKSAYQQHQDAVTQSFKDALRGTEYDPGFDDDRGQQPAFDLEPGAFRSDRTATGGKR